MTGRTGGPQPPARGVAVVTGASSGIGRSLAEALAGAGYDLVLAADAPEVHPLAQELEASSGRRVVGVHVDLSGAPGVEHLHELASAQDRPVTLVVLIAGVGVHGRPADADLDTRLRDLDLDVRSTVHLATLAARDMAARREGRLLFVSSVVAQGPGRAADAAAQEFVHTYAEVTRQELLDTGVGVTSLLTGRTDAASGGDDDVARQGVEALLAGRAQVVASPRDASTPR